jgi:hypothetical protein
MSYEIHTTKEMLSDLTKALENKTPFAVSSLGDGEQIFLACPEIEKTDNLREYLKLSGITPEMKGLKEDVIQLLPKNNYIYTHFWGNSERDPRIDTPAWDWARFFYKTPDILKYYKMENIKLLIDLPERYGMVTDGSLFEAIKGARVLLVGAFASKVEELFKNPSFISYYKAMNLDKIKIVGSMNCSQAQNAGEEVYLMEEKTKEIDFDVALVGMGVTSLHFIPSVKLQGKIAINIGHTMSALAGKGDPNRVYINKFNFKI